MRAFYLKKLLKHLNENYSHLTNGEQTMWYFKDKVIALWDNGDLEVVWEIFRDGVLLP